MIAADGRTVWVHDSSIPVFAPDGSLDYFLGFMIDITERKLAEERQRATEQRYRDLVERLPAVTYLQSVVPGTNVAEATTFMSPLIEGILGYPVDRWYSDVAFWRQIAHPDDREVIESMEAASEETGESFSYDHRLIARRRPGRVGARRGGADPQRGRRRAVLAGLHPRHHRAQAGRGTAASGRGAVPPDRGADTGRHVPGAPLPTPGAYDLSTLITYVSPQIEAITRIPARPVERTRVLGRADPPRRPGAGPGREQRGERLAASPTVRTTG